MPRRRQPPPYEIEPFGLPSPATRSAVVKISTWVGLPDRCWLAPCRRARRCSDPEPVQLPDCFWRHRRTIRLVAEEGARRAGLPVPTPLRPGLGDPEFWGEAGTATPDRAVGPRTRDGPDGRPGEP